MVVQVEGSTGRRGQAAGSAHAQLLPKPRALPAAHARARGAHCHSRNHRNHSRRTPRSRHSQTPVVAWPQKGAATAGGKRRRVGVGGGAGGSAAGAPAACTPPLPLHTHAPLTSASTRGSSPAGKRVGGVGGGAEGQVFAHGMLRMPRARGAPERAAGAPPAPPPRPTPPSRVSGAAAAAGAPVKALQPTRGRQRAPTRRDSRLLTPPKHHVAIPTCQRGGGGGQRARQ